MSASSSAAVAKPLISTLVLDDPDMLDIVEEFVAGLGTRVAEFSAAYEKQAWNDLKTLAHQLKGAGGSYGYAEMSTLGATMEQAFKNHSAEDFSAWMKHLSELIARAQAGLGK